MNEEDKNLEERMTRHFDVVLEGIRGAFKVFGEGLSDLSRKFDGLTERVGVIENKIDVLNVKVNNLTDRIDVLTVRVDKLSEKVEVLTVRMDDLTGKVDVLTVRVDGLTDKAGVLTEKTDLLIEDMDYVKSTLVENKEKDEKAEELLEGHETRLVKLENSALAHV
jgi:VCBS repeat-containing protein